MMKKYILVLLITMPLTLFAQDSSLVKKVLFLGNSYTNSNNLPGTIANLAASAGDQLEYNSVTPGGYRFEFHVTNQMTIAAIEQGDWDYVVLQEQSQIPSFPYSQFLEIGYPYAEDLDEMINANNCAETVFFMTWGRENGDQSNCEFYAPLCTYEGMDSLLRARYEIMANDFNAILSPVGAVWRYIRENHPTIDLYSSDGSHPSALGSYAAACTFYTTLFRKSPLNITDNGTASAADAIAIKNAVNAVVYNHLEDWNIGDYDPIAGFNTETNETGMVYTLTNSATDADSIVWDMGDGNFYENDSMLTHEYAEEATYTICQTVFNCQWEDSTCVTIEVSNTTSNLNPLVKSTWQAFPNPVENTLFINDLGAIEHLVVDLWTNGGKRIKTFQFKQVEGQITIDFSNYPKGIYLLKSPELGVLKVVK